MQALVPSQGLFLWAALQLSAVFLHLMPRISTSVPFRPRGAGFYLIVHTINHRHHRKRDAMKRMIPATALASSLVLSALILPSSHAETKPDDVVGTETRAVAPFSAIALSGPFHVIITGQ